MPLVESPSITDDADEEEDYVDGEMRRRQEQDWEMCGGPMFYLRYEVGKIWFLKVVVGKKQMRYLYV